MTRKDYRLIATVVRAILPMATRQMVAHLFATALAEANPKFDTNKFLEACGG